MALDVARTGMRSVINVSERIAFIQATCCRSATGLADLIVSNPPYVPDGDAAILQPEVARFEPATALYGGADGLAVIRRLLVGSAGTSCARGAAHC